MAHSAVAPEEFSSLGSSQTQSGLPVSSYSPISKGDMHEEEASAKLAELIKTSQKPANRWERNRLRQLDQIPSPIDSVLVAVTTCYQTLSDGSSFPVDSLLLDDSINSTYSKVIPTWVPTTQLEREHYFGRDGNKTG